MYGSLVTTILHREIHAIIFPVLDTPAAVNLQTTPIQLHPTAPQCLVFMSCQKVLSYINHLQNDVQQTVRKLLEVNYSITSGYHKQTFVTDMETWFQLVKPHQATTQV